MVIICHNLEKMLIFPKICHFFYIWRLFEGMATPFSIQWCSVSVQKEKIPLLRHLPLHLFAAPSPYTSLSHHHISFASCLLEFSFLTSVQWKGVKYFLFFIHTHYIYTHAIIPWLESRLEMISWDLFLVIHRCEFKFASSVMLLKIVTLVKIENLSKHKLSYENYLINIPYF